MTIREWARLTPGSEDKEHIILAKATDEEGCYIVHGHQEDDVYHKDVHGGGAHLSADEAWELVIWWTNGYCSWCGESIPQDRILCRSCLGDTMDVWGIEEAQ